MSESPQKYKLIVGLGNPDKDYEKTRHNVGFVAIDKFALKCGVSLKREKKLLSWCEKKDFLVLAKPHTFMNNSGNAVSKLLLWFKLQPSEMVVVHDEVALDLGKIRISEGRSSAGHHGVESIISALGGNQDFTRLRIGVGPDPGGDIRKDFVLSRFTNKELKILEKVISLSVEAIDTLLGNTVEFTMNKYNGLEIK